MGLPNEIASGSSSEYDGVLSEYIFCARKNQSAVCLYMTHLEFEIE